MGRSRRGRYREKGGGQWHGDLHDDLPLESQHANLNLSLGAQDDMLFALGQRWTNSMEPELGLGTITAIEKRRVTLSFQEGACVRQYSTENAPIKRVVFQEGDQVALKDGTQCTIDDVSIKEGIASYKSSEGIFLESELSDRAVKSTPLDRILTGHCDTNEEFELRKEILHLRARIKGSPYRGFMGGRIELLPHQLYIAQEVSLLQRKQILLADEVGLGKTIEAALILHRLLVCDYVTRVLILVPESMVHVWFVELLRKFNLSFKIYNEEYYAAIHGTTDKENPLYHDQLVLGDINFFTQNSDIANYATAAQWDLLIVDEAHRLKPGTPSFACVEKICASCTDRMFLTATPQQDGENSHFARLRLLDPSRYNDFDQFLQESAHHKEVAAITGRILDHDHLEEIDREALVERMPHSKELLSDYTKDTVLTESDRKQLVATLIDCYGIGRALFRNTRSAIGGFPGRKVSLIPLDGSEKQVGAIHKEFFTENQKKEKGSFNFANDPRLHTLLDVVQKYKEDKFLIICTTKEKAQSLVTCLKQKTTIKIAEFHEGLSLIQRDRNAAWFLEEQGARLLISSEIGSEGRNFQRAHQLIMWDVPVNPGLVEQRIGRLDRIGQSRDITIHVPYVKNTPYEVLIRLFHEGLDMFNRSVSGVSQMFEPVKEMVEPLYTLGIEDGRESQLVQCIAALKEHQARIAQELEAGRDRLLEQHSFRPVEANRLVQILKEADNEPGFKKIVQQLFRTYGIVVEELSDNTSKLYASASVDQDFPGLSPERPIITFDRATAIRREDYDFITHDHPAIRGGMDMFLGSEKGNATVMVWNAPGNPLLLVNCIFVLECIAPPHLFIDRYLSPTPIEVLVDQTLANQKELLEQKAFHGALTAGGSISLLENQEVRQQLLPSMIDKTMEIAQKKSDLLITHAKESLQASGGAEVKRLQTLSQINREVTQEEVNTKITEMVEIESILVQAKPRLDAVRFIVRSA